jgi:hypothetical protein
LSDGGTSAIITPQAGISDTTISDNLLAGGGYAPFCPKFSSTNMVVNNNRFGRIFGPKGGSYGPWVYCNTPAVVKGNVWDDTLVPMPL